MAAPITRAAPAHRPHEADWPTELRLLLGPDAGDIVGAAARGAGGELVTWAPRQVTHQPGRSTMVQYRAEVHWPEGPATTETIVAATGDRMPDGAAVLDNGTSRLAVWRWPTDPALPGLGRALDRTRMSALLDDLGIGGGTLALRVRAYRPGRRAVIEATGRQGRLFIKIVRPKVVEALHATHRALSRDLPVPDSLGWTDDGLLVLPALRGQTLRVALRSAKQPPPAPAAIDTLLDRLPAHLVEGPRRRDALATAAHHASVVAAVQPDLRSDLDGLLDEIAARLRDDHAIVPVHGDLYEAQLLVNGGRISGLLDIDTAGAGHRVDDLANLCAHLSVLALVTDRPKGVKRYGAAVLAHAEARSDRIDLRARIAAAVIGLATGPFRVLEANWPQATARRVELAQAWLDGTGDERDLTPSSGPSHRRTAP